MENHIVLETPKTIRSIARQALKNNWLKVVLGYFIFYFLTNFVPNAIDVFIGAYRTFEYYGIQYSFLLPIGSSIFIFLFSGVFTFGSSNFFKTYLRTREIKYDNLFDGFNYYGKIFLLFLLYIIKIYLWSLLFVVPGIIASYRYSQAFLILTDHPDYSPKQCINESKRLMDGNKGKLFVTQLSYIGWMLLAYIPNFILNYFSNLYNFSYMTAYLLGLITAIPMYFVYTYLVLGNVTFYDLVTERLVATRKEEEVNENN